MCFVKGERAEKGRSVAHHSDGDFSELWLGLALSFQVRSKA